MDSLIVVTILFRVIFLFAGLFLFYKFLNYIGFNTSMVVLSVVLHFLGGYLMFFS
jgi:hypothetical protein